MQVFCVDCRSTSLLNELKGTQLNANETYRNAYQKLMNADVTLSNLIKMILDVRGTLSCMHGGIYGGQRRFARTEAGIKGMSTEWNIFEHASRDSACKIPPEIPGSRKIDVAGDGSCLFHSLRQGGTLADSTSFRSELLLAEIQWVSIRCLSFAIANVSR